jgi:WD40 repeat protein
LIFSGHDDYVFALAWSPDSMHIASGSRDRTVQVWRPYDGESQSASPPLIESQGRGKSCPYPDHPASIYHGHKQCLLSLAWSHDGQRIASGDTDGIVNIWNAFSGETLLTYHGHVRFVRGLVWSPDDRYIASGGDFGDSTVQVWKASTGEHIFTFDQQYRIFALKWSADGRRIASASFNGSVLIWDAFTGINVLTHQEHSGPLYALDWSPDGKYLASGGQDSTVRVWDAVIGKTCCLYKGHARPIKALCWSPNSRLVASAGDDTSVQVWNAASGKRVFTYKEHTKWIRALGWSPDGKHIASASDRTVHVWRWASGVR